MSDTTPVTCPECGLPGQFVRDRGFEDGSGRVYECRNDTCGNHRLIFYAPTTEEMERQISARKTVRFGFCMDLLLLCTMMFNLGANTMMAIRDPDAMGVILVLCCGMSVVCWWRGVVNGFTSAQGDRPK